jgi:hypothetical protein
MPPRAIDNVIYWGGGPAQGRSVRPDQFTGTADFVTPPIPGVGRR